MHVRALFVALCAFVLGADAASAQQPTPAPLRLPGEGADGARPVTEESMAAARRLIQASGSLEAIEASMPQMMTSMITPLAQARGLNERDTGALIDIITEEMRSELSTLMEMSARAYARRFTVADMNAVIAFYESAPGRRFAQATPALMTEMLAVGQAWGAQIVGPRVVARVEELTRQGKLQTP
jgi:hypothetical protein